MSTVKRGEVPTLFESPLHCCGCGACAAACPKGAIAMSEGKDGFILPVIDGDLCIGCGACTRACGLNRGIGSNSAGPFFAAAGRDSSVPLRVSLFLLAASHMVLLMSVRGIRFECCTVVRRALMSFARFLIQNTCRAMLEFALPMLRRIFVRAGRSCSAEHPAKSPALGAFSDAIMGT